MRRVVRELGEEVFKDRCPDQLKSCSFTLVPIVIPYVGTHVGRVCIAATEDVGTLSGEAGYKVGRRWSHIHPMPMDVRIIQGKKKLE